MVGEIENFFEHYVVWAQDFKRDMPYALLSQVQCNTIHAGEGKGNMRRDPHGLPINYHNQTLDMLGLTASKTGKEKHMYCRKGA